MIILKTLDGKLFANCADLQTADLAAKSIIKRKNWSNLCYHITDTNTHGVIDLEPSGFHNHKRVVSNHLKTFWGNIAGMEDPKSKFHNYLHIYKNVIPEAEEVMQYIKTQEATQ